MATADKTTKKTEEKRSIFINPDGTVATSRRSWNENRRSR